jgi:hypothetical protein
VEPGGPRPPGAGDGAPFTLPADLWDELVGGTVEPAPDPRTTYDHRVYPTADDAWAGLSRAGVTFGRRLAGIPPLPPLNVVQFGDHGAEF